MENNHWQKRLKFIIGFIILAALGVSFRLFQKQILEHSIYLAAAAGQYIIKKDLPAQRGKIYANDLFPLATNRQYYQVLAIPRNIRHPDETAGKLATILGLKKSEIFEAINNSKNYIPPLKHGLTEEEADKVADLKITGILVMPEAKRFYPEDEMAAQILGFVNASGNGQYGIEGFFNDQLKGFGGEISAEKDIKGRFFSIGERIEPRDGSDYVLTIDRNIQFKAEEIIK